MRFIGFLLAFLIIMSGACLAKQVPGEVLVKFEYDVIDTLNSFTKSAPEKVNIKKTSVKEKIKKLKVDKIEKVFKGAVPYQTSALTVRTKKRTAIPDLSQIYLLTFPKDQDVFEIVNELKRDPNVIYAEPNYILKASTTTPNDPSYSSQLNLTKINMGTAWDLTQGSSSIIIAVVDTGVRYTHEDLTGKVLLGPDYVNDDLDPNDDSYESHGTHVAGIAAASTNNSKGIAGVDWNAKILAIKVLDQNGDGSTSDLSQGIRYAADYGASVINLSLGSYNSSSTLQSAATYATDKGCVLAAAAGNESTSTELYPAAYSNVLAVAATDENDQRASFSNYGSWIDVCAPGTDILSTYRTTDSTYAKMGGTSMSTPHVCGLAALLLSVHPSWTYTEVFDRIKTTATNVGSGLGSGRINAQDALSLPVALIDSPSTSEVVAGTIQISGTANALNLSNYRVEIGAGSSPTSYTTIETKTTAVSSGTLATYTTTATSDGTYTIKLVVQNTDPDTTEATRAFIIDNTNPTAAITSPSDGASITDSVTITGTASDANIYYYKLEYSSDGTTYEQISASTSSVAGSTLGTWNTAGLNGTYTLRLTVVDKAGNTSAKSVSLTISNSSVSSKSASGQSYASPNPFNPTAQSTAYISYTLSGNFNTSVFLFDITGKLIFRRNFVSGEDGGKTGKNMVPWDGKDNFGSVVPNGVYIFKVAADGNIITKGKIIILY